jgi:uncharacterized protein
MRGWIVGMVAAAAALAPAGALAQDGSAIEAAGPLGPLRGSLAGPGTADAPVVLIIPGSGPTDRDGNSPLGVRAGTYRLLAEALAARGVTTIRIDKRGMYGSSGAVADANAVTVADYAQDVHAWSRSARERTGARCVWLLGHSEGGLIALAAAQRPEGICGLVLVAAPGRRLSDALREQLRANPANAPLLDGAMAAIARLEAGERVDPSGLHPALQGLFAPAVQNFLISLFAQDPAALVGAVRLPVLIVQGGRDIQITEEDARRLASGNAAARLVLLPEVNHVLKRVASDDRAANLATYADPDLPLADGVVEPIADFVRSAR